jgi:hypothetical protein
MFRKKPKTQTGRQRILSGDTKQVPQTLAYYAKRATDETNTGRQLDRPKPKDKLKIVHRYWVQRFGLLILIAAVVICVFSLLSLSNSPKVVIVGDTTTLHSTAEYTAAAHKILASSILNSNKLTVDVGGLKRTLQKQFPDLSTITVTLPLVGHRPIIYIGSATPSLLLASSYGNFIVDDSGRVLSESMVTQTISTKNLPHVTDQSGVRPIVGEQIMSSSTVGFITVVNTELLAKQIQPTVMTLPPSSSELDVQLQNKPYFVKFNLQTDTARVQAGTFLATQAHLAGQGITPREYIDVRVEGRAYYK